MTISSWALFWILFHLAGFSASIGRILLRSSSIQDRSLRSRLSKLVQTSIVAEFRSRFEVISNNTVHFPDEFLNRCFISGPRLDVEDEVAIWELTFLEEAIRLAQMYEQKLNYAKALVRPDFVRTQILLLRLIWLCLNQLLHHLSFPKFQSSVSQPLSSRLNEKKDCATIVMRNRPLDTNARHFLSYFFWRGHLNPQLSCPTLFVLRIS